MTKTRDTASGSTKKKFGGQTKLEAHTSGVTVTGNISATGTVDGRDVAADGTKLDTVATSSNNYVHPTGAGNNHIPTGGAADQVLTYSSSGVAAWADAGGADLYAANESSPSAQPSATGANAIAIGDSSTAGGNYAAAMGSFSVAGGVNAFSGLGTANGDYAVAVGVSSQANSERAIALGNGAITAAVKAVGIGYQSNAAGTSAVSIAKSYASGTDSLAAIITNNTSSYGATGSNSVAMVRFAKASGPDSLAFGRTSQATSAYAVAMGYNCLSSANYSVALGYQAQATGSNAFAAGASSTYQERANATAAGAVALGGAYANGTDSVAIGASAKSTEIGKISFSNDKFAANGDSQGGLFILRADTTDATATVLTTNNSSAGSTNQIVAVRDARITFSGTIVAMQNGAQAYGSWEIKGLLVNDGGTTTVPTSAITVIHNSSSWGLALSADNTNNALTVQVTGEASHNIRWVANIQTAEVTYA